MNHGGKVFTFCSSPYLSLTCFLESWLSLRQRMNSKYCSWTTANGDLSDWRWLPNQPLLKTPGTAEPAPVCWGTQILWRSWIWITLSEVPLRCQDRAVWLEEAPWVSSPAPLLKAPDHTLPFWLWMSFPAAIAPLLHSLAALMDNLPRRFTQFSKTIPRRHRLYLHTLLLVVDVQESKALFCYSGPQIWALAQKERLS